MKGCEAPTMINHTQFAIMDCLISSEKDAKKIHSCLLLKEIDISLNNVYIQMQVVRKLGFIIKEKEYFKLTIRGLSELKYQVDFYRKSKMWDVLYVAESNLSSKRKILQASG